MKTYTVKVFRDNCLSGYTREWYLDGVLHREDGPAIEFADGTNEWRINGKLHREDGPAVECSSGAKYWYANGTLDRHDGPAIEHANGTKEWVINGNTVSEDEFNRLKNIAPAASDYFPKIIELDGVKYRLVPI